MEESSRKVVFYGAISIDGYIARENHALDWLIGTEGEDETGYEEFYDSIDTLIMGRNTYEQVQILSPDEFPYKGKKCYVFSNTLTGSTEFVEFKNENIIEFTKTLKQQNGKNIWIVGGGNILQSLLQEDLIDELTIQIAPTIIGKGIPLFTPNDHQSNFKLIDVKRYKQFAEIYYKLNKIK